MFPLFWCEILGWFQLNFTILFHMVYMVDNLRNVSSSIFMKFFFKNHVSSDLQWIFRNPAPWIPLMVETCWDPIETQSWGRPAIWCRHQTAQALPPSPRGAHAAKHRGEGGLGCPRGGVQGGWRPGPWFGMGKSWGFGDGKEYRFSGKFRTVCIISWNVDFYPAKYDFRPASLWSFWVPKLQKPSVLWCEVGMDLNQKRAVFSWPWRALRMNQPSTFYAIASYESDGSWNPTVPLM